jgi:hypothetical protein
VGCFGGKISGFFNRLAPDFEYFLSCGIPGKLEGERYKKSPELVKELLERWPKFKAPARFIVFKRWDKLEVADNPDVVIFLSRMYYRACTPWPTMMWASECNNSHGFRLFFCSTKSLSEKDSPQPRGIIGMLIFCPSLCSYRRAYLCCPHE